MVYTFNVSDNDGSPTNKNAIPKHNHGSERAHVAGFIAFNTYQQTDPIMLTAPMTEVGEES